ncbi:MAG: 3-hydroxyacyl-CoA dehydrogenase [Caulobacteraceae bacterium]|nr:3-hydroxyacyl-CoA dehydrogenase [Caulobacteraceae bacterium]
MENFKLEVDGEGLALITFDVPGKSMNVLGLKALAEIGEIAERLKTDAAIKGAVIASGKSSGFCAGADLVELGGKTGVGGSAEAAFAFNKAFRALETCGKPVAAAIEGLAMGGGLELTLACHRRVVADNPRIQLALPETKIGLLPGGGGTQRLSRLIGVMAAGPYLLEGKSMSPKEALDLGVIHELAPVGATIEAAKAWLRTGPDALAPWDRKDFKIPGGGPYTPSGAQVFMVGNAMVRKSTYGNYPAQENLLRAVYEGLQLPFDQAIVVESRYLLATMRTPQARAMIRTLFLGVQAMSKGAVRPQGYPVFEVGKAAVLGAGMMGAGIAQASAQAGIDTVLIDVDQAAAEAGLAKAKAVVDKAVARGRMDAAAAQALLARITPTADYSAAHGADIIIEAVFESREVKKGAIEKAEHDLKAGAVFGSNTSTIPITSLAQDAKDASRFIGIHFFSPVDRMPLVEIIRGEQTSDETVAKAVDYVLRLKKTPIVVRDSRGFYTSRCFSTFVQEGMAMVQEGIAPAMVDNIGRMTGMPRGPLEMADDVALDLAWKISSQARADLGTAYKPQPAEALLQAMVEKHGRFGRKNGMGFYDYPASGEKNLWPGLAEIVPVTTPNSTPELIEELKTRLLYRQAVEAARCCEEGVITDPRAADVGAILGWGFAPWSGGPLSLIDMVGAQAFVETCKALAKKHGERFAPPKLLIDMAAKGGAFYPDEVSAKIA